MKNARAVPSRLFFAAVLMLAACVPGVLAGDADPEIVIQDSVQAWSADAYYPVTVHVRSRRGTAVAVTIGDQRSGTSVVRRVTVPPGTSSRVEMTYPGRFFNVHCEGGGEDMRRHLAYRQASGARQRSGPRPPVVACLNGFMLRELELLDEARKKPGMSQASLSLDEVPGRWQSYVGLTSVLVMNAREVSMLRPDQREAVGVWVRWFGGRVWLSGEGARAAAASLGLPLDGRRQRSAAGGALEIHSVANGLVAIQSDADVGTLVDNLPVDEPVNPLVPYFSYGPWGAETPGVRLLESLAGISTDLIIIALLLLGIIMGPINYWFIRRRRNSLLFFITTPLIAIGGAVAIIAATFVSEGLDSGYNQHAVLIREEGTENGMIFDSRGLRSGFFVATPRFSPDSLVLPIATSGGGGEGLVTDVTDGVSLVGGWLKPRFPSGFLVVRPVVSRMGMVLEREAGVWHVANDLGFAVSEVAAELPDGRHVWAENVLPGERKRLRFDEDEARLRGLFQGVKRLTNEEPAFLGVTLVARSEGLPYLEDGNLDSDRLSGEYYYAVVGTRGGVGP